MKLMVVSTLYPPVQVGGAEVAAARLAEGLVRAGWDVTAVSLHAGRQRTIEQRNGVRVYREPLHNLYWPFSGTGRPHRGKRLLWQLKDRYNREAAARFREILDSEKPDLVHTHNVSGFSVSIWEEVERLRIPVVHTIHDYNLLCGNSKLFCRGRACTRRCLGCAVLTWDKKRNSRRVDAVVGVSREALLQHMSRGYFTNARSAVIYNIAPAGQSGEKTARHSEDLTFGYIGRITVDKGIEILLRAMGNLRNARWRLRIAGSGDSEYVHRLKLEFDDPRIEWLGFTDPKSFYESVDVVVVPSIWPEPLPYACMEALFTGNGLICARSGGIPELAALADVATLVTPGAMAELKDAIDLAIDQSPAWRRNECVSPDPLSVFKEDNVLREYTKIYNLVLADKRQAAASYGIQAPLPGLSAYDEGA